MRLTVARVTPGLSARSTTRVSPISATKSAMRMLRKDKRPVAHAKMIQRNAPGTECFQAERNCCQ